MAAYIVLDVNITDPEAFEGYKARSTEIVAL